MPHNSFIAFLHHHTYKTPYTWLSAISSLLGSTSKNLVSQPHFTINKYTEFSMSCHQCLSHRTIYLCTPSVYSKTYNHQTLTHTSYLNLSSYPMMGNVRNIKVFVGFRFPKHHWVFSHWFNSRSSLPSHKFWSCILLLGYVRDNLVACICWMGEHRLLTEGGCCISRKQNKMILLDFRCRLTNTFLAQHTFSLNFTIV